MMIFTLPRRLPFDFTFSHSETVMRAGNHDTVPGATGLAFTSPVKPFASSAPFLLVHIHVRAVRNAQQHKVEESRICQQVHPGQATSPIIIVEAPLKRI